VEDNELTKQARIVLCDDEPDTANNWKEELDGLDEVKDAFEVIVVDKTKFEVDVLTLEERRNALRRQQQPDAKSTIFDSAAVLIVDYDLYEYKPDQLLTGDSIAYLARSYSSCGYIVGVNQDRISKPFDLTLVSHALVSTDLSIGSEQVADPGLWSGDPGRWGEFRPWYWPVLPERAHALEELLKSVIGELDDPLATVLGLPRELLDSLPRAVLGRLDVPGRPDIGDVPLREWVHSSQMGLRSGDTVIDDDQIARVASARLAKWFERVLLPGQDVLVDAPHLVDRRPGLLDGDSRDPDVWQLTTRLDARPDELGLTPLAVGQHRFETRWVSRPVWLWPQIATDQTFDDSLDAPRPEPRVVFAEDASRFVDVNAARRYTSDVEPPFNSRWVAMAQDGTSYLPTSRLASA
jgi:hypothetical protein